MVKALDGGAPKEKSCEPPSETQKAFTARDPGKPLMVSNTELCFLFGDSGEALPKVPQHKF